MIFLRQGEAVLGASPIEISVIHAHSPLPIRLGYHDHVGDPFGISGLLDELGL